MNKPEVYDRFNHAHDHNASIKITNDTMGGDTKPGVVKTRGMDIEYVNEYRD